MGDEIDQYPGPNNITSTTSRVGAVFTFQARTVVSRVGVSFISEEQACQNVESQIPHGTSLETLESKMRSLWNEEILSKVTTSDTANTTALQLLYTSLYHMSLLPTNKTGENPLWESSEPYYDDIFTLWDTVSLDSTLLPSLNLRSSFSISPNRRDTRSSLTKENSTGV